MPLAFVPPIEHLRERHASTQAAPPALADPGHAHRFHSQVLKIAQLAIFLQQREHAPKDSPTVRQWEEVERQSADDVIKLAAEFRLFDRLVVQHDPDIRMFTSKRLEDILLQLAAEDRIDFDNVKLIPRVKTAKDGSGERAGSGADLQHALRSGMPLGSAGHRSGQKR